MFFPSLTYQLNLGLFLLKTGEKKVYILLIFKVTLLFFSVIIFNNQVGNGGKNAFSRKSALAHSHPLKYPCDG